MFIDFLNSEIPSDCKLDFRLHWNLTTHNKKKKVINLNFNGLGYLTY